MKKNELKKGAQCIGQEVFDTDGNKGIITNFYVVNGKKSKVTIEYEDGTVQDREKYAVEHGTFRKPYLDDIDQCIDSGNWKYIPGFNQKYIISNLGEIKSACGINKGKLLSPSIDTNGYKMIVLQITDRNNRKLCRVHRLVAETFLRPIEKDEEVNHIDGDKQNNKLSNLEIISRKLNNEKHINLIEMGLSKEDIDKIENICLSNKLTLKEYISQLLKNN